MSDPPLEFAFEASRSVRRLVDRLRDCIEAISLEFDGYGKKHVKGPGLYVAIVSERSVASFAEPMGNGRWPIEDCDDLHDDLDRVYDALQTVAETRDGGVVVGVDGSVLEPMVRFRDVDSEDLVDGASLRDIEYADWMGARHMSAYETSLRPSLVATLTLSEETGRMTTFQDGEYETVHRADLGTPWRGED